MKIPAPNHAFALLLLLIGMLLVANRSVASQYPFDPVGARHVGMGAASAAMWMGPEAIYHNPASLVWQTLTMGAGIQPVQFVDTPASWWVHFYNKETAYGVPAALVAQGWDYTAPDGDNGHYLDLGLPVAFNFTDSTPGAATIHFAFEKRGDGKWEFEMPLDFGFLARHPSGATLGIVARGVTIGNNGLESVRERIEYGASYGAGGLLVLSTSVLWYKGDDWETVKDRYRIGGEFGGESKIHVLGGYIHEPDNWFYTGGIVLRSDETGRFEFIYSVIYDHNREFFGHFIQYGVRWY